MSDNTVVIYGAGASYASGYKVKISTEDCDYPTKPLMDEYYFDQEPIKKLVEDNYSAINLFIDLYFGGNKKIGLEELWTAVDLNRKHITLDTYDWREETYNNYLVGNYWSPSTARYKDFNIKANTIQQLEGGEYDEYKFLDDCLKSLKDIVYDSLSVFDVLDGRSNYSFLHNLVETKLLGYITFNYDLLLENSLYDIDSPYRYIGDNEDFDSSGFFSEKLPIAKLHGSLNWKADGNRISFGGKKPIPIKYDYNRKEDLVIIPPTLSKQEINDEGKSKDPLTRTILQQWRAAIKILTEADNLIFVGYSFPPTDFHAKRIFQIAMMQRRAQNLCAKVLYCGDGYSDDNKVRKKLEGIFGHENKIIIKNKFEELCKSDELKKFLE